jgi:hypothetical protein
MKSISGNDTQIESDSHEYPSIQHVLVRPADIYMYASALAVKRCNHARFADGACGRWWWWLGACCYTNTMEEGVDDTWVVVVGG